MDTPAPVSDDGDVEWIGHQASRRTTHALMLVVLRDSQHYDVRVTSVRTAFALYPISGPIVHIAHRKYLTAIASLVLRAGSTFLWYELGSGMTIGDAGQTKERSCLVVGAVLAAFCDAFALGRE